MASVKPRNLKRIKNGKRVRVWDVEYRDPFHRARSRTFKTKAQADDFAAAVEHDKAKGTWTDPRRGKVLLSDWAQEWLTSKVDLRMSSRARLEGILREHILPAFGSRQLRSITNAEIRAWVAELSTRRSPATVRKAFTTLHQMLRAAVADQRIALDPALDVPLPSERDTEYRFLTVDEVETLAEAIHPRFKALVLVASYGGLRWGEMTGLRRKRVDLLRSRISVAETLVDVTGYPLSFGEPKTKRSRRTVPIPADVMRSVSDHLDTYVDPEADSLVFTSTKGAPLRRAGFNRSWWQPAVRAAGVGELRVHDLRHTYVSLMAAAGLDIGKVSVWAGHSTPAFTLQRYRHLFEDDERGDMEVMQSFINKAPRSASASVTRLS
jgi:integrase